MKLNLVTELKKLGLTVKTNSARLSIIITDTNGNALEISCADLAPLKNNTEILNFIIAKYNTMLYQRDKYQGLDPWFLNLTGPSSSSWV